jgi:hypothetical protein
MAGGGAHGGRRCTWREEVRMAGGALRDGAKQSRLMRCTHNSTDGIAASSSQLCSSQFSVRGSAVAASSSLLSSLKAGGKRSIL